MRGTLGRRLLCAAALCAALMCAVPVAEGKRGTVLSHMASRSIGNTGGKAIVRNPDKENRHDTAWKVFVVACVVLAMYCAL